MRYIDPQRVKFYANNPNVNTIPVVTTDNNFFFHNIYNPECLI